MKIKFSDEVAASVKDDFERFRENRRAAEAVWRLNVNFAAGNQNCRIGPTFDVEDTGKDYFWQEREVYNHIAQIVETRLAKLARVRPVMSVRPASGDDDDIKTARTAGKVLGSVCRDLETDGLIGRATRWSELCGSAFYKVSWDENAGLKIEDKDGGVRHTGDIKIDVCPPFEIFPSSVTADGIENLERLIHARVVSVDEIERVYGKKVNGESLDLLCQTDMSAYLDTVKNGQSRGTKPYVMLLERYTAPTDACPDGELAAVAGGTLLYLGSLPYENGEDGKRVIPFIKQDSIPSAGSFFGSSMIERLIPVQRAYNAVKNRKHEFLNRISMGVLAVEDGSVDVDGLEGEGLSPGKILVYRQGSTPPRLMEAGHVPADFSYEEDRLLTEFINISGVSEIMRSSAIQSTLTSGIALQLLIDQDDTRLTITADCIRAAVREAARQILRLYRRYASVLRLTRCIGEGGATELVYWKNSDISTDEVVFDTESEINQTPAAKRTMMLELLKMGLLHDENGKLGDGARYKILDAFGYGGWEQTRDLTAASVLRAEKENLSGSFNTLEIDDHDAHIREHSKHVLSVDFEKAAAKDGKLLERYMSHIREHKRFLGLIKEAEGGLNAK